MSILPYMRVFGPAEAPPGYVLFNEKAREEHPKRSFATAQIEITPVIWGIVREVNSRTNAAVSYQARPDVIWAYPTNKTGDCRSIALLKRQNLVEAGIPRGAMALALAVNRKKEGHVVILLRTSRGELVLDSETDTVSHWSRSGLTFVKRQIYERPIDWVALDVAQHLERE